MSNNLSCNNQPLPAAAEYLNGLDSLDLGLTIGAGGFALIVVFIYLEELLFMYTKLQKWHARPKAVALLAIYPVHSVAALLSIMIPRAASLNDIVTGLYLSVCLYIFMHMLMGHYGGKEKMTSHLLGTEMSLQGSPCCCCCFCLPKVLVTKRTIHLLEALVFQYCIIRVLVSYVSAVGTADLRDYISMDAVKTNNFVVSGSTILAIFGLILANRVSMKPLAHAKMRPKLYCIQLVLLVDNLQKSIFALLGTQDVIPCGSGLSASQNAVRIHRMLMTPELLLISLLARHFYRRYTPDGTEQLQCRIGGLQRLDSYSSTTDIIGHDVCFDGTGNPTDSLPNGSAGGHFGQSELGEVLDDRVGDVIRPADVSFQVAGDSPTECDA